MRNNFECFGNYLFIDEMRSFVLWHEINTCITPVVLNEIGLINIVCEKVVIPENHDACTFILESLFKVTTSRNKKNV